VPSWFEPPPEDQLRWLLDDLHAARQVAGTLPAQTRDGVLLRRTIRSLENRLLALAADVATDPEIDGVRGTPGSAEGSFRRDPGDVGDLAHRLIDLRCTERGTASLEEAARTGLEAAEAGERAAAIAERVSAAALSSLASPDELTATAEGDALQLLRDAGISMEAATQARDLAIDAIRHVAEARQAFRSVEQGAFDDENGGACREDGHPPERS
jgi:hypothetical protein